MRRWTNVLWGSACLLSLAGFAAHPLLLQGSGFSQIGLSRGAVEVDFLRHLLPHSATSLAEDFMSIIEFESFHRFFDAFRFPCRATRSGIKLPSSSNATSSTSSGSVGSRKYRVSDSSHCASKVEQSDPVLSGNQPPFFELPTFPQSR